MSRSLIIQTKSATFYWNENGDVFQEGNETPLTRTDTVEIIYLHSEKHATLPFDDFYCQPIAATLANLSFTRGTWIGRPTSVQTTRGSSERGEEQCE